jgi:putative cell wall-binding protein
MSSRGRLTSWAALVVAVAIATTGVACADGGTATQSTSNGGAVVAPAAGALVGASASTRAGESALAAIERTETQIGRRLDIDHQFYRWDSSFPTSIQQADASAGRIPFLNWKPQRNSGAIVTWSSIAGGAEDGVVKARADAMKAFGRPMLFSFNAEPFDESRKGWGTPAEFVDAFRHIVSVFRAQGATNVSFAWVLTGYDFTISGRPEAFYPGDEWVDWIGADPYNFFTRDKKWQSFSAVAGAFHTWGAARHKPLVLAEWGTEEDPAVPGRKAAWFTEALATLLTWPEVKAVVYFNNVADGYDWTIDTSPTSLAAFASMANTLSTAAGASRGSAAAPPGLGGPDRYATAAAIAATAFPSGASTAVVASGDAFADALAAAYPAGRLQAPVLLTRRDEVPAATLDALRRLGVSSVKIVGGRDVVSDAVAGTLASGGRTVTRAAGIDRWATAASAAAVDGGTPVAVDTVLLASGEQPADALVGGPIAFAGAMPILLTNRDALPAATAAALRTLAPRRVVVLGGTSAITAGVAAAAGAAAGMGAVVDRVAGADRYATATALADFERTSLGWTPSDAILARGDAFADALAGAPLAAVRRAPILLTPPLSLAPVTASWLGAHGPLSVTSLGLDGAISPLVRLAAAQAAT